MMSETRYRGRFAPSPTGALHFGSLVAAVGSYLQAKSQHGEWFIRIDNIDPPREVAGASDDILRTLEMYGFQWDGDVTYQGNNHERYLEAVQELLQSKQAYHCQCSRKTILEANKGLQNKTRYPGLCRHLKTVNKNDASIRLLTEGNSQVHFNDLIQGPQLIDLEVTTGDFVLQRRDGYFSYHLASAIDDAEQGITEVVRGSDLLEGTANQLLVQQSLNLNSPHYCHLPLALNSQGQKLSKQSHARPISELHPSELLCKTLKFLGQLPPKSLSQSPVEALWQWAIESWKISKIDKNAKKTL